MRIGQEFLQLNYIIQFGVLSLNEIEERHRALSALVLVVFLWGVNSISIKYLTQFFPPLALAPIRLSLAAVFLLLIAFYRHGWHKVNRQAWLSITGIAVLSIFLHQIALTYGIKTTSATHSVIILGSSPLITILLANVFFKEAFTLEKCMGIVLGMGGLFAVVCGKTQGGATFHGDLLVFVAMITFVCGSFFVKQATITVPPLVVTAYSHCLGAAGLMLLGLTVNPVWTYSPDSLAIKTLAVLLFSSFISTAIGAVLWNMGIQKVGATTASLFQNASPIIGVFASAFFLGEQVSWQHFAALSLVLLGVVFGAGMLKRPVRSA